MSSDIKLLKNIGNCFIKRNLMNNYYSEIIRQILSV